MLFSLAFILLCLAKNGENRRMVGGRSDGAGLYKFVVRIGHRELHKAVQSRRSDNLCNETLNLITKDCIMFRTEDLDDHEWMITRTCSGSVLSPKWTLTAGHCLPTTLNDKTGAIVQYADFGDFDMSRSVVVVKHAVYHPNTKIIDFNDFLQLFNDIGLLQHEPVKLKTFGKISAVLTSSVFGQKAVLAGLGNMPNGQETKELLLLDVLSKKCDDEKLNIRVVPSICVARLCGTESGICEGDSGGPLIHASGIIGVSSLGLVNCELKKSGYSGTTTAVAPFLKWMRDVMKDVKVPLPTTEVSADKPE